MFDDVKSKKLFLEAVEEAAYQEAEVEIIDLGRDFYDIPKNVPAEFIEAGKKYEATPGEIEEAYLAGWYGFWFEYNRKKEVAK